jgi:hypothetical protein
MVSFNDLPPPDMLRPGFIEREWQVFAKACVPPDAGPQQVADTRAAFIAGALVALGFVHNVANVVEDDKEAANHLTRMHQEILALAAKEAQR